jgi:two-component system, response regulator PdtaR
MQQDAPPTMLVVDDEDLLREMISDFFCSHGFRVLEAANADQAVRLLESLGGDIAILVSDIRMPGSMDGIQLADWVHARSPHLPVLLASGYHGYADFNGRYEIIPKPFALDDMLDRVKRHLAREVRA